MSEGRRRNGVSHGKKNKYKKMLSQADLSLRSTTDGSIFPEDSKRPPEITASPDSLLRRRKCFSRGHHLPMENQLPLPLANRESQIWGCCQPQGHSETTPTYDSDGAQHTFLQGREKSPLCSLQEFSCCQAISWRGHNNIKQEIWEHISRAVCKWDLIQQQKCALAYRTLV